jgi:hypothetical protein
MNRQLIEIASWRLVSELMRRYPNKYTVIQTYPGGGMYDCLSLFTKKDHLHVADFNREGSFHVFLEGAKSSSDIWQMMFNAYDMKKDVLNRVSELLRMPVPVKLPSSTPEIVCYRFISAFLSQTVFTRDEWRCINGYFDSSAPYAESGMIKDYEKYPGAIERLRTKQKDDIENEPSYRFWFLRKDKNSHICLETTGNAWSDNGSSYNLMELYKKDKRMWPLVCRIAGRLLP